MKIEIQAEPGEAVEKAASLLKAIAADLAPASAEARLVLDLLEEEEAKKRPLRQERLEGLRQTVLDIAAEELQALEAEILVEFTQ